jgi:hypothetical protein
MLKSVKRTIISVSTKIHVLDKKCYYLAQSQACKNGGKLHNCISDLKSRSLKLIVNAYFERYGIN